MAGQKETESKTPPSPEEKKANNRYAYLYYAFLLINLLLLYITAILKYGTLPVLLISALTFASVLNVVCLLIEYVICIRPIKRYAGKYLFSVIVAVLLCMLHVWMGSDHVRDLFGGPVETVTNAFRFHSEDGIIFFRDEQGEEKEILAGDRAPFLENMEVLYDDRGQIMMDHNNYFIYKDHIHIKYYPHSEVPVEIWRE